MRNTSNCTLRITKSTPKKPCCSSEKTDKEAALQTLRQRFPCVRPMPRRGGINARLAYDFFRFLKRPQLAHLERIVAAMLCQLQLNWPDRYWKCRFDRLVVTASKGQSNRVIAKMEPAICLLLCRACVRLPYIPAPKEEQIHAKVISTMVTP